jgi:hypothetical protein
MGISCHLFMPLLTELGLWEMGPCYKHVAPNGAFVLQRQLLKKPSYLNTPLLQIMGFPQLKTTASSDARTVSANC